MLIYSTIPNLVKPRYVGTNFFHLVILFCIMPLRVIEEKYVLVKLFKEILVYLEFIHNF